MDVRFGKAKIFAQSLERSFLFLVSGLRLNGFFLIFSANSMPWIVTAAV
jgi:hypothetical protein